MVTKIPLSFAVHIRGVGRSEGFYENAYILNVHLYNVLCFEDKMFVSCFYVYFMQWSVFVVTVLCTPRPRCYFRFSNVVSPLRSINVLKCPQVTFDPFWQDLDRTRASVNIRPVLSNDRNPTSMNMLRRTWSRCCVALSPSTFVYPALLCFPDQRISSTHTHRSCYWLRSRA